MAGLDPPDPPCRYAMAVPRGGEPRQARRVKLEFVEIVPFRGGSHCGRAFAGGEADDLSPRCGRQMSRQDDIRMRGGNSGIENRAQQRASVGHGVTALLKSLKAGIGTPLSLPSRQKKTPEDVVFGGLLGLVQAGNISRRPRR